MTPINLLHDPFCPADRVRDRTARRGGCHRQSHVAAAKLVTKPSIASETPQPPPNPLGSQREHTTRPSTDRRLSLFSLSNHRNAESMCTSTRARIASTETCGQVIDRQQRESFGNFHVVRNDPLTVAAADTRGGGR